MTERSVTIAAIEGQPDQFRVRLSDGSYLHGAYAIERIPGNADELERVVLTLSDPSASAAVEAAMKRWR